MKIQETTGRKVFNVINVVLLSLVTLSCILPILHILALSLSDSNAAAAGLVKFWPVDFSLAAYHYLIEKKDFFHSVGISALRVLVGSIVNMLIIVLTAYPLSKPTATFKQRNKYMVFFAITMFIGGGLIPTYMVIKSLHLLNNFWVLILPGAVNMWNIIIMMNFFRGIPTAMEDAASIDGASHWQILFQVFLPMSLPALASLLLFTMIGHWNSWFDGMFYMNSPAKYPMSTFLATQIINNNQNITNMTPEQLAAMTSLSDKAVRSSQLFLSIVPILIVYPFLQKFFIKGIVVGSVKE